MQASLWPHTVSHETYEGHLQPLDLYKLFPYCVYPPFPCLLPRAPVQQGHGSKGIIRRGTT